MSRKPKRDRTKVMDRKLAELRLAAIRQWAAELEAGKRAAEGAH